MAKQYRTHKKGRGKGKKYPVNNMGKEKKGWSWYTEYEGNDPDRRAKKRRKGAEPRTPRETFQPEF